MFDAGGISMEKIDEVFEFYNAGAEKGRLERGLGKVELYRTKEILKKYITNTNNKIFDIGGGIGIYSSWLSEMNNEVHLLELAPSAVEYAVLLSVAMDNPVKLSNPTVLIINAVVLKISIIPTINNTKNTKNIQIQK